MKGWRKGVKYNSDSLGGSVPACFSAVASQSPSEVKDLTGMCSFLEYSS